MFHICCGSADAEVTDMARADMAKILKTAARPGLSNIFGSMEVQPCWIDTGDMPSVMSSLLGHFLIYLQIFEDSRLQSATHLAAGASATAAPQGLQAEDWRVGVQCRETPNKCFRYGIIRGYDNGIYEIRYDDGKVHESVDPGSCVMDWVQPDAHKLATAARKGELVSCLHMDAIGRAACLDVICSICIHHVLNYRCVSYRGWTSRGNVQGRAMQRADLLRSESGHQVGMKQQKQHMCMNISFAATPPCTVPKCPVPMRVRLFGAGISAERAIFSLHDMATRLDTFLVGAHYVPLFSHLKAPGPSSICAQLEQLASAEELVTDGLHSAEQLAASLQPINTAVATHEGMLHDCPCLNPFFFHGFCHGDVDFVRNVTITFCLMAAILRVLTGTIRDRAKEIKKVRKKEVKAAKRAADAKRTGGRAGINVGSLS